MKRHSVKTEFTLIFVAITAALLLSLFLSSKFFLKSYYERDKVRIFSLAYETLDRLVRISEDSGSDLIDYIEDEFDSSSEDSPAISILRTLNEGSNIDIALMDIDKTRTVTTGREANWLNLKLYTYVSFYTSALNIVSDGKNPGNSAASDTVISFADFNEEDLKNAGIFIGGEDYKLITSTDNYIIHRINDMRSGQEYIECFGIFSDKRTFFIMSSPLSNISEGVKIATKFMFTTGLFVLVIGAFIVYFAVSRLTRPIMKLARLSDKMSNLDFSERYNGNASNEIGVLGNSMNTMSDMLESYIRELREANRMLQEDLKEKIRIDEARKEFIANVSHELKTPIALIEGYAEGLTEGLADDREQRDYYCNVIIDETLKMNRMVCELTSLISYEFGSADMTFNKFNLAELIRSVTDSLRLKLEEHDAVVLLEMPDEVYIVADEFKIEEVYTNYLNNAINHLDGERRIIVRITDEQDKTSVYVYNDGENIPESSIPHLWEKFYKVDKARTRSYGGSGIGLSIVRAIIDSHGGHYGVVNRENGVEFFFDIPKNIDVSP